MDQLQKDWLAQLTGKREHRKEVQALNQKRDAIRSQVESNVNRMSDELYSDMDLTVSDGKRSQKLLDYGLRDQTAEFDLDDQQEGYTLMDDADVKKHLAANRLVTAASRPFDEETEVVDRDENGSPKLDSKGKPLKKKVRLFDEASLGAEFYQPLVRQGLMAETFVPDAYSETQQMKEGAFEAYGDRLKEDYIASPMMRFIKENKSLALTTVSSGIALASAGIKGAALPDFDMQKALDSDADPLSFGKDLADSSEGAGPAAEIAGIGWDIVAGKGLDAYEDIKEGVKGRLEARKNAGGSRLGEFDRLASLTVAQVAAKLSEAMAPFQLEVAAASAFSSSVSLPTFTAALIKQPLAKADVAAAATALAAGAEAALRAADPKTPTSTGLIDAAAATIRSTFASSMDAGAVTAALVAGNENYAGVISAFSNAAAAAFAAATGAQPFAKMLTDGKLQIAGQLAKKAADDMVAEMDKADEDSQNELATIRNAESDEKKAGMLARKIAAMERDQQILKWASGMAALGFDIASKFFAPMAIAGSAVKLSINIAKAAMRTRDFLVFAESQMDMFRSASAYSAPVDNFISNAGLQMAHYQINAALEAVNMIGAVIETAGLASGMGAAGGVVVGKAMQATAAAGQAIEAVLYEIKKRYDVEQAWNTYRTALLRPANRKLGLIAMKKNPTLAKYAVAWGAVIKKDPLVGDFMGKCGLDSATLEDPKSNLDQVVKYLEVRMPDDSTITGRLPVVNDWEPPNIELTAASWAAIIRRAEQQAKLVHSDTRAIELALTEFPPVYKALQDDTAAAQPPGTGPKPDAARYAACVEKLNAVNAALGKYHPTLSTAQGEIQHEQMKDLRDRLKDLVEATRHELAALKPAA